MRSEAHGSLTWEDVAQAQVKNHRAHAEPPSHDYTYTLDVAITYPITAFYNLPLFQPVTVEMS